jgi:hypothetical protein
MKLLSLIISAATFSPLIAQTVVIQVLPEETVLARLHQAAHNNIEREGTLKKLFEETGCTGQSLEEQPVKHAVTTVSESNPGANEIAPSI